MPDQTVRQVPRTATWTIRRVVDLRHLLYLRKGYEEDETKRWPLIPFLHGAGERGEALNDLKRTGLPAYLEEWDDFPFVVVSPQCEEGTSPTSEDIEGGAGRSGG